MAERQVRSGRTAYGQGSFAAPTTPTAPQRPWKARLLFAALVVFGCLYGLWRAFRIEQVAIEGATNLPVLALEQMAQGVTNSSPLNDNLLTLSNTRLKQAMLRQEPQLADVRLVRRWPHGLLLRVTEKELALNWRSGERTYLVDSGGSVVGEGENSRLVQVTDETGLSVSIGDRVVPSRFVGFVTELTAAAGDLPLKLVAIRIATSTSEVVGATDRPFVVKFATTRSARGQVRDLKLVLAELKQLGKTPAEYIDLRVAGKAYYK